MKVLLIDVDSKIPNLALMQISTVAKQSGHDVQLVKFKDMKGPIDADLVFASIVFKWNAPKGEILEQWYPFNLDIGGSGWDIHKKLPENVSRAMPDYSIYPDCDYDLGFSSRGCIRHCKFCIVPRKEGAWKENQHPVEFHDPAHKKVMLLDNNILANKEWFFEVASWIHANKMKVDFNQGLDIRLLDLTIARKLATLKPFRCWKFAFDSMSYKDDVIRGLKILRLAGVDVRNKVLFYVYTDSDDEFEDALERCNILRNEGTLTFIMFNKDTIKTQRITDLKRWCRPWIFFKVPWDEYNREVKNRSSLKSI